MRGLGKWGFVAGFTLLLGPAGFAQPATSDPLISPIDLVRAVVVNELKPADRARWMYELEKEEDGQKQTRQVVQTRQGSLEPLIAIDGHSLPSEKQQEELVRIEKLVSHPREWQKLEEVQRKEAEQCETFFKLIPEAFVFSYDGHEGGLIKIRFKPNPAFQPSSREARMLHALEGEMLVEAKELRLATISGHLMQDVKFGAGLLGYLQKGGKFSVTRTKIGPGQWALTAMDVDMKGKALFLKTIAVQQKEYRTSFRKVTDDLTVADAANLLTGHLTLAANH